MYGWETYFGQWQAGPDYRDTSPALVAYLDHCTAQCLYNAEGCPLANLPGAEVWYDELIGMGLHPMPAAILTHWGACNTAGHPNAPAYAPFDALGITQYAQAILHALRCHSA